MTSPVQPLSSMSPLTTNPMAANQSGPGQDPASPAPAAQAPAKATAFTVEVSRAASAPVYVYRMTDTATGRILVEIPNDPTAQTPDAPGGKVDAKV